MFPNHDHHFQTVISCGQSDIFSGHISASELVHSCLHGNAKYNSIYQRVRAINDREKYKRIKQTELPAFAPNFYFDTLKKNDSVLHSTNFIYIDVDKLNNKEFITIEQASDFRKKLIEEYGKNIFMCFLSTGGRALGILIPVLGVTNTNYKNAHTYISRWLGISDDERTKLLTQLCVFPHDQSAFINWNCEFIDCTHIPDSIQQESTSIHPNTGEFEFDPEFVVSEPSLDFWRRRIKNGYYWRGIISDKKTHQPVKWENKFKFIPEIHDLSKYFTEEIIELFPCNKEKTLAYIEEGICQVGFNLFSKMQIRHKSRRKRIKAICSSIIKYTESAYDRSQITKTNLFSLITSLNEYCTDEGGNSLLPLPIEELVDIACKLWREFTSQVLNYPVFKRKCIYTEDFACRVFRSRNVDIEIEEKIFLLVEIQKIKKKVFEERFYQITNKFPDLSFSQLAKQFKVEFPFIRTKTKSIERSFFRAIQKSDTHDRRSILNSISSNTNIPRQSSVTFLEIEKVINCSNRKLTQKLIADILGCSKRTIIRKWNEELKTLLKNHNQKANQLKPRNKMKRITPKSKIMENKKRVFRKLNFDPVKVMWQIKHFNFEELFNNTELVDDWSRTWNQSAKAFYGKWKEKKSFEDVCRLIYADFPLKRDYKEEIAA